MTFDRRAGRLLTATISVAILGAARPADAQLQVNPISLTFNAVVTGETSAPMALSVSNIGGGAVTINSVSLNGQNPTQFKMTSPAPITLKAGDMISIPVTYAPLAAGAHTATVVIVPAGLQPTIVRLTGTAIDAVLQVATGGAPPDLVDFGDVAVGNVSAPFTVGLKVPPNGFALQIDTITSSDPQFVVDTARTRLALAPGASTVFDMTFKPTSPLRKNGTVAITVLGSNKAVATVRLTGNGTGNALQDLGSGGPGDLSHGPVVDLSLSVSQPDGALDAAFIPRGGGTSGCVVGAGRGGFGTSGVALLSCALLWFRRRRTRPAARRSG